MSKFLKSKKQSNYQKMDESEDDDPFDASINPQNVLETDKNTLDQVRIDMEASNIDQLGVTDIRASNNTSTDNRTNKNNNTNNNNTSITNNTTSSITGQQPPIINSEIPLNLNTDPEFPHLSDMSQSLLTEKPPKLRITCGKWDTRQGAIFFLILGIATELIDQSNNNITAVDYKLLRVTTNMMFVIALAAHILGLIGIKKNHTGYIIYYIIILYIEIAQVCFYLIAHVIYIHILKVTLNSFIDHHEQKNDDEYIESLKEHLYLDEKVRLQIMKENNYTDDDQLYVTASDLLTHILPFATYYSIRHFLLILVTVLEIHVINQHHQYLKRVFGRPEPLCDSKNCIKDCFNSLKRVFQR